MKKNWSIILLVILTAAVSTAVVCYFLKEKPSGLIFDSSEIIIKEKDYVQILFVGDLMFDRGVRLLADKNGNNEYIFNKITPFLLSNDIVVANLEGPITTAKSMSVTARADRPESITFTFDPSLAKTLFEQNIRIVNLGNNHILNFGVQGAQETEKYLKEANVSYFGTPQTKESTIENIKGVKIAFVSYNYYEFRGDLAKAEEATINEIKKVRPLVDIVIVYTHWGDEYKLKNNQAQQILAHKFIDQGADLIIGSHPHVIQNIEDYKGKKIYYSLGNFIFDQDFNENVKNGLGVVVKINKASKEMSFSEKYFYTDDSGQPVLK